MRAVLSRSEAIMQRQKCKASNLLCKKQTNAAKSPEKTPRPLGKTAITVKSTCLHFA
jgi:hypothetical protein